MNTIKIVTSIAATSAMINQNPVVVHSDGGKPERIIVSDLEFATETDGLLASAVTTVSQ